MPHAGALQAVLQNPSSLREIADGLYSALPDDADAGAYDRRAAGYEAVVRWPSYHRMFWGSSIKGYTQFSRTALEAAGPNHFAEVGCGSLLFTGSIYRDVRASSVVLVDRSRLFVSALVKTGRWSDAYLKCLHRAGEMGPPMTPDELTETVAGGWGQIESRTLDGNMCYLTIRPT